MNVILTVMRKDLRRKIRSPLASISLLLFPVVFSLIIGAAFGGGGGGMAPVKIALVDQDQGLIARLIRSSFSQDRMPQRFDVQVADSTKAIELIENNKVSAVLRVPPGFSDSLLASKPTHLGVIRNPAQQIYPEIAEQYVKVLAQLGSAAMAIMGEPIGEISDAIDSEESTPESFVSRISVEISRKMEAVARYAFPPAISIDSPKPKDDDDSSSGGTTFQIAAFILPGMAVYALLMLALISMSDIQREKALGTLSRQAVSPIPLGSVILGKVAATWVLSLVCIMILLLMVVAWVGPGISLVGFVALSLALAVTATGFTAFIQSLSGSERTGSAIGSILIMAMSMLGGCWIPLHILPSAVRSIAPYTLIYWGSQGYRDILFESATIVNLLPNLAILLAAGGIFAVVAIMRFRHRYGTGV